MVAQQPSMLLHSLSSLVNEEVGLSASFFGLAVGTDKKSLFNSAICAAWDS